MVGVGVLGQSDASVSVCRQFMLFSSGLWVCCFWWAIFFVCFISSFAWVVLVATATRLSAHVMHVLLVSVLSAPPAAVYTPPLPLHLLLVPCYFYPPSSVGVVQLPDSARFS